MRRLLLNFKNEDEVMTGWSTFEFGCFLYEEIGYPLRKRDVPKESRQYYEFEEDYPNIGDVNPLFLEINIHSDIISDSESIATKRIPKKIDFEKQNNSFRVIGTRGEEIVLKAEKDYLRSIEKRNLIKKVIRVSKDDDSLGYDILSFDENGIKKYIEVKSTKASPGTEISFILSSNQYMKAKELNNYYLYLVFDVKTMNPRIWKIKNPLSYENKGLSLIPSQYKATIITLPMDI
jgi:signal peptidase I